MPSLRTRLSSAWSAIRGRAPRRAEIESFVKGYYGTIRGALRASVPGGWASDHYEETLHYTGWNYIAGHATALQCAAATVEISRPAGPPGSAVDAWSGKANAGTMRKRFARHQLHSGRERYFQAIHTGGRSLGSGLLKSHDQQETEEREILPESFGLTRLMNRPNPSQSGGHLRYETSVQLSQTGTALIVKIPNRFGKAVELYCVPTCLMTPRPACSQFPYGAYYVSPAATRTNWADDSFVTMVGYQRLAGTTIDMRDLIKISFPHPLWKDEGYSPLAAGSLWSDASEQIDKSRFSKMQNNADPSLVITPGEDTNPTDNEIERVVDLLAAMYGGPSKAGRIMVAPGGSKVDQLGVTPRDMDYAAGFDQFRNAIMGLHGVPLIAAGITDGGSYAAFYAALKQFIFLCVQPRLDWIAEELTYQLAEQYGEGLLIRLIAQSVDDPQVLEARLATDIAARSIKKNEIRQLRGLEATEDGDVWAGEHVSESVSADAATDPSGAQQIAGAGGMADDTTTGISTGEKRPQPQGAAGHFAGAQSAGSPSITAPSFKRLSRLEKRLGRLAKMIEQREAREDEREQRQRRRREKKRLEEIAENGHNHGHSSGNGNGNPPPWYVAIESRLNRTVELVETLTKKGMFNEADHPRGQPGNSGQFGPGGGHGAATKPDKKKPSLGELSGGGKPGGKKPGAAENSSPSSAHAHTTMQPARREGKGKDAKIILADGKPAPAHIKPSMVPPQWSDVHVSTDPNADVLVRARDSKGRIKIVQSDNAVMRNAAAKFSRVSELVAKRHEVADQIQQGRSSHDPKTREAADCLWLIENQATRPGSDKDTKAKVKAYGATTLRAEHVEQDPDGAVRLHFIGKEGIEHNHVIRNPDLAKMLVDRKQTAGERGGRLFDTTDDKLRSFTGTLGGGGFTPKDFRTMKATLLAADELKKNADCCKDKKEYKAAVKQVATAVSHVLGNRPQQAIESYINPTVWTAWQCPDCHK